MRSSICSKERVDFFSFFSPLIIVGLFDTYFLKKYK
jgi:hypothetical protein